VAADGDPLSESLPRMTDHVDTQIRVMDLFAGSGGLGEGFSAFEARPGHRPFRPYQVSGDTLQILRVYHGSRQWPEQFA
jgi:hypothetical protein